MTTRQTRTNRNDAALRARVRLFGQLLGEIVWEHAGEEVYTVVEALRKGFIRQRQRQIISTRQHARLMGLINELPADKLTPGGAGVQPVLQSGQYCRRRTDAPGTPQHGSPWPGFLERLVSRHAAWL